MGSTKGIYIDGYGRWNSFSLDKYHNLIDYSKALWFRPSKSKLKERKNTLKHNRTWYRTSKTIIALGPENTILTHCHSFQNHIYSPPNFSWFRIKKNNAHFRKSNREWPSPKSIPSMPRFPWKFETRSDPYQLDHIPSLFPIDPVTHAVMPSSNFKISAGPDQQLTFWIQSLIGNHDFEGRSISKEWEIRGNKASFSDFLKSGRTDCLFIQHFRKLGSKEVLFASNYLWLLAQNFLAVFSPSDWLR